jgi:outer membrane protein TolC
MEIRKEAVKENRAMTHRKIAAAWAVISMLGLQRAIAQEAMPEPVPLNGVPATTTARFTLQEAKERAIASNKLLNLASMNVKGKEFATRAMQANYGPQIGWMGQYFHFNEDLGTVVTTRGLPRLGVAGKTINAAVFNQDSPFNTLYAAQPLTDLLKVKQGVRLAQADERIAQAEWEKGIRALAIGVEQLYWGWLATEQIRAGALEGVKAAEALARMGTPEVQIALVEAKQGLQEVDNQLADIEEQLRNLLDLPSCTRIELVPIAMPELGIRCADEVIAVAISVSPEVRSAEQDIEKARAATKAAKLEYVPSIALVGGIANQDFADYIQPDFAYVGFLGHYTFIDWGKRRNTIRERENMIAMAQLKCQQVQDEVRQNAAKAFREYQQDADILKTAQAMVEARQAAVKKATTPEAMHDPTALIAANKAFGLAQVDLVKAQMNYRVAAAKVMNLMGR